MRLELYILLIAGFIIANIYTDGKYTKMLTFGKKYYQMAGVAFGALIAFVKIQQSNRGYTKRRESEGKSLVNSENLYKLKYSPFKNIGRSSTSRTSRPNRSGFKNIK